MIKKIICAALLPVIFSTNVNAEEVKEIKLTLQDSIEMALKSNLDLAVEEYNPEIQRLNVQKIRDEFGLYLGLAPQLRNNVSPTSNSFISGGALIEQFTQNYGLYLKKRFEAGGELSFNFDNSISSTNSNRVDFNPAFAPGLSLSFTQPILRNAFNGSRRIMIGENQTKAAYWDVIAAKLRLEVLLKSLSFSEDLLKVNQERLKAGFASKVDIINAETVIATRQESVYQIRKDLGDAEDRLKRLINPDEKLFPNWRFNINATDSPVIPKVAVDTDKSFETAVVSRPDYQISLIDQQNIDIQKEINNQNRLPTLNLTSSAGLQSLDKSYFSALGNLFGFKGYFWNVGLAFEVPIQGNVGETEFRQSLLNEKKQEVVLDNLKQKIYNEIRNSVRAITVNNQRINSNSKAKNLAQEQLNAETEKLKAGFSTSFQVLQYQRDLEQAGLNEVNAIIDYIKSLNDLEQAEGSSVEKNNLSL